MRCATKKQIELVWTCTKEGWKRLCKEICGLRNMWA